MKSSTLAVTASATALLTWCCAPHAVKKGSVSPDVRRDAIRRAQVWEKTDIPSMDLKAGPQGHGAFAPEQLVDCRFVEKQMSGNSPKFTCIIPPDDEVKVKFGRDNGEVYAEVAATRLFWALGFPADHMYPVKVRCEGCPEEPGAPAPKSSSAAPVLFDPASIERKFKGHELVTSGESGWAWRELDDVQESAGGAPMAQRDALRLLAVFVQHTDSKPAQQRLTCVDQKDDARGTCEHPVMMVNDLGQTFGRSNLFNRDSVGSVNLSEWTAAKIWADPKRCIGYMPPSQTGTLDNPEIHESGRKFLSDLLTQLSDQQLHDLFEVARFEDRSERLARPAPTIEEWVSAFKKKRGEIASLTCPL